MMLTGYPPEDLVLAPLVPRRLAARTLTGWPPSWPTPASARSRVVVGYLDDDGGPRNAAAFLLGGRVVATYFKHHLPNYGVFDEHRYFVSGDRFTVVRLHGVDIALTICEDAWQEGGPFAQARAAGVDLVVNINGSPYERNKDDVRLPLLQRRAIEAGAPVAYVNTVGAQDELVFDGDSFVVGAQRRADLAGAAVRGGPVLHRPRRCRAATDRGRPTAAVRPTHAGRAPRHRHRRGRGLPAASADDRRAHAATRPRSGPRWCSACATTRARTGSARSCSGMSGGIDSAVVAAIAADAIGGENVYGVSMPSAYSSDHSKSDAADLAERLGAHYREVPIAPMTAAFVDGLELTGLAEENVQARVRGTTLMALSNAEGHLVLATGNKSELAVGYSTIYGDAVGGFAPIKDVPEVAGLGAGPLAQRARRRPPATVPRSRRTRSPSRRRPSCGPGQLDSDSLPDYEVLDAVLARYVDGDESVETIIAAGFDAELVRRVARLVDTAEWKRRQYPPGPKISLKAFGRDRRLPITNRWREGTDSRRRQHRDVI